MSQSKIKIALTGGGTAGHVIPHLALLPAFSKEGWELFYIGSSGVEKGLAEGAGIPFRTIQAGKLRRYFSWQNFLDFFKVGLGFLQALLIFLRERPKALFSKGGFVSSPVAYAAWVLDIPVITHESDFSPGLTTKLIAPIASRILTAFPETQRYLPAKKTEYVGTPVRADLFTGQKAEGYRICGFKSGDAGKPVLLVMGGSLGAVRLNAAIEAAFPELLHSYRVVHLTGKGKSLGLPRSEDYAAFEYVNEDLKHLFAIANLVISRAGANSIFELLALNKPMLLVPLEAGSRGDQIQNAECFAKHGWARVVREKDLGPERLISELSQLRAGEADIPAKDSIQRIVAAIRALV